ncbi:hypothetical protein chiPu_0029738, partial [Chiloscyllium punctatum]|nr:hypothetical protein [Chiloscyllium punctatum]
GDAPGHGDVDGEDEEPEQEQQFRSEASHGAEPPPSAGEAAATVRRPGAAALGLSRARGLGNHSRLHFANFPHNNRENDK